jgi:hypothetical protein
MEVSLPFDRGNPAKVSVVPERDISAIAAGSDQLFLTPIH